ncbi:hypothetical protein BDZ45DRAFT_723578 [Acephala macrosclerotiorum]|nr:hypothetical protein BDZ45DRAFT_723578 [Acephala macrosclerotiorum]
MARTKTSGVRSNKPKTTTKSKVARKAAPSTGEPPPLPQHLLEAIDHASTDDLRRAMEELCFYVPEARDHLLTWNLLPPAPAPNAETKAEEAPIKLAPANKKRKRKRRRMSTAEAQEGRIAAVVRLVQDMNMNRTTGIASTAEVQEGRIVAVDQSVQIEMGDMKD